MLPTHHGVAIDQKMPDHKTIKLFFWRQHKWHHETVTMVWDPQNVGRNATQLIKQWLLVMHDEHVLNRHVSLESIAVSSMGNEAYISFDRSLFAPEWSVIKKWMVIESLIKTVLHNDLSLHSIMLMVHHKPMNDDHIDFSQPLPVQERI